LTSYDVDMNAQKVLAVVANWFSKIGVGPSDNSDLRLKKTL
jgi:hypothetical protein